VAVNSTGPTFRATKRSVLSSSRHRGAWRGSVDGGTVDGFFVPQQCGQAVELVAVDAQQLGGPLFRFADPAGHLPVDEALGLSEYGCWSGSPVPR
jgi:hypothetical protein